MSNRNEVIQKKIFNKIFYYGMLFTLTLNIFYFFSDFVPVEDRLLPFLALLIYSLSHLSFKVFDNYLVPKILGLIYFFVIHTIKVIVTGGAVGSALVFHGPFIILVYFLYSYRVSPVLSLFYVSIISVFSYLNVNGIIHIPQDTITIENRIIFFLSSLIFLIITSSSIKEYVLEVREKSKHIYRSRSLLLLKSSLKQKMSTPLTSILLSLDNLENSNVEMEKSDVIKIKRN
jgi:hypothetical protein